MNRGCAHKQAGARSLEMSNSFNNCIRRWPYDNRIRNQGRFQVSNRIEKGAEGSRRWCRRHDPRHCRSIWNAGAGIPGAHHRRNPQMVEISWRLPSKGLESRSASVAVELEAGGEVHADGEFCEIDFPRKLVMTRKFDAHPFQGTRETTITYRFEPSPHGTLVTVRDEGFIGRSEAASGNAEIWEKVLGWLNAYLERL
jgi:uncharacterized protein YndB with AHSA1/START domain